MQIKVLDHGYVEFVEAWGGGVHSRYLYRDCDELEVGIVEAARQSTQASFRGWDKDLKLLRDLYRLGHSTPFEFAGMTIEIQAPIMVFREWHRHRTQSYSEMSARYSPLPDLYYHCPVAQVLERARTSTSNKQAAGVAPVDQARIEAWVGRDEELALLLEAHYQEGLAAGVPKELARKKMPVDHYSRMRASANLHNWLRFLTLRLDPAAQWEIRQFTNAVAEIVKVKFPRTYQIFTEEQHHG